MLLIGSLGAMWAWWGKQFREPKCGSGHVCRVMAWTKQQGLVSYIGFENVHGDLYFKLSVKNDYSTRKNTMCFFDLLKWNMIFKHIEITTKYAKQAPTCQPICNWHKQFMETRMLLHKLRSGRPRTSEEEIECINQSFTCSLRKSICTASI